ncbi:MAG TPA: L,D-transpeptidase/peptidoglycan binding protein [Solirubrobacteraceae bacterium]|jgi:lipoprotein-anchoring transpeptidase ErfK/SrfK|nr:L,D-transpeptidase/peptidoglycan binding protein [Solirubrobacteraceae bacterium]
MGIFAALFTAVVVVLAAGMYLYDHGRRDEIAKGVRIDGVDVGGMRAAAARAKVQRDVVANLNGPVTVRAGEKLWTLSAREAGLTVDTENMVAEAVSVSRGGSIFTRTARGLFGGSVKRNIPLVVSYSHRAVRGLVAKVSAAVNRAPRDATVSVSASGLTAVPARVGLTVDGARLAGRIERALNATGASRTVAVPAHGVKPAVTTSGLGAKYPGYIVVDRSEFRLRFYDHLKLAKTYEIAVGMEGLETPGGLHKIEWEQVDPPWYVPKKAWAGALAGTVVPPGPADPLKARFMSFDGGAGIHGIDPSEYSSIGHDASHGCIRMRIPDVIALYSKSPVGTPVYII